MSKTYYCNDGELRDGGPAVAARKEIFREHQPGDGPKFCPTGDPDETVYRASTPPRFYTMKEGA